MNLSHLYNVNFFKILVKIIIKLKKKNLIIKQYDILTYDYRGYGISKTEMSE